MKQQHTHSEYSLKPKEVDRIIYPTVSFRDRCILKSLYWLRLRREECTLLDIRGIDFEKKELLFMGKDRK